VSAAAYPDNRVKKENALGRVLVALSGGIDSAVAAVLLKNQGYDVVGAHLKFFSGQERLPLGMGACSLSNEADARKVCEKVHIPFHVIDASSIYGDKVVDFFLHECLSLRRPNPCIACNRYVKFGFLLDKAKELKCDSLATGHYARVTRDLQTGVFRLLVAHDRQEDQSYLLHALNQDILSRVLLPLGGFSKAMVLKLAAEFKLEIPRRPAPDDGCFSFGLEFKEFVESRTTTAMRPRGPVASTQGEMMGEHEGLYRYGVGQNKDLPVSIRLEREAKEFFVVGFDQSAQKLLLGKEAELMQAGLKAFRVAWIRPVDQLRPMRCMAKIRQAHPASPCEVISFENSTALVRFDQPQGAISPGQSIVFYEDEEVLGGGTILSSGDL